MQRQSTVMAGRPVHSVIPLWKSNGSLTTMRRVMLMARMVKLKATRSGSNPDHHELTLRLNRDRELATGCQATEIYRSK